MKPHVNYKRTSLKRSILFFLALSSNIVTSKSSLPSTYETYSSIATPSSNIISSISGGTSTQTSSILEIYEIETFDESTQSWSSKVWITSTNELTIKPTDIILPDEYEFTSSWKIDVSGHRRDELGWEYFSNRQRRRRWLRPYTRIKQEEPQILVPKKEVKKEELCIVLPKKSMLSNITEFLSNQYNFKGFGCFVSKSLLYKKSCGLSVSFPITANIDFLERRPYIPAIRGGARIAYGQSTDWMVACYFSISLPRVIIRTWYNKCWDSVYGLFNFLHKKSDKSLDSTISSSSGRIIQDISEKIGFTLNFCYSQKKGYELLPTCWYTFLPTLQYIINSWVSSLLSSPVFILNNLDILKYYTSSMGLSTTLYPYQTCSLGFSLSGFYFSTLKQLCRIKHDKKQQRYEKLQNRRIKEIKELISDKEDKVIDTIIQEDNVTENISGSDRNDTAKVLVSSNI